MLKAKVVDDKKPNQIKKQLLVELTFTFLVSSPFQLDVLVHPHALVTFTYLSCSSAGLYCSFLTPNATA